MELEAIKSACAQVLNVDPNEITEETSFTTDLCADSLDVYQIITCIEDDLGIELKEDSDSTEEFDSVDAAIDTIITVADAIEYLKSRQ